MYFLITSCYRNKSSWKWQHRRKNIAIIKTDGTQPKMISERPKYVKEIVWAKYALYEGLGTGKSQFDKAYKEAEDILDKLNENLNSV
jgi:hypothetical protein